MYFIAFCRYKSFLHQYIVLFLVGFMWDSRGTFLRGTYFSMTRSGSVFTAHEHATLSVWVIETIFPVVSKESCTRGHLSKSFTEVFINVLNRESVLTVFSNCSLHRGLLKNWKVSILYVYEWGFINVGTQHCKNVLDVIPTAAQGWCLLQQAHYVYVDSKKFCLHVQYVDWLLQFQSVVFFLIIRVSSEPCVLFFIVVVDLYSFRHIKCLMMRLVGRAQ